MKHQTNIWLRILPGLLLLCFGVSAQQRQDTAAKQELALSISHGDDASWELPAVKGTSGGSSGFRRLESWEPSEKKEPPVVDINFDVDREGDIVIAHLSVRLENDKEVMVGTYRLHQGETIKTEELTKFGVVPLVLKVVKAKPPIKDPLTPIMPKLENKTKAVEVVSFIQSAAPFDDIFELSLRNISNKTIVSLDLSMPSADGNGGGGQRRTGDKDHPLMLPGDTSVSHIGVSRGGRMTPDGYLPDVAVQQTIIITTVVFSDGTYDGLAGPAADMEAQRRGQDIQRRRILGLFQQAEKTNDGDLLITLEELKEQAYALGKTADASVALDVIGLFPTLDEKSKEWLPFGIEAGLRTGKMELLHRIKDFEDMQTQPGGHISFAEWLKQTKADYEKLTTITR